MLGKYSEEKIKEVKRRLKKINFFHITTFLILIFCSQFLPLTLVTNFVQDFETRISILLPVLILGFLLFLIQIWFRGNFVIDLINLLLDEKIKLTIQKKQFHRSRIFWDTYISFNSLMNFISNFS